MSLKPFTYPFPETRFLHAGPNVYKFKIRYGNSIRGEEIENKDVIIQELEVRKEADNFWESYSFLQGYIHIQTSNYFLQTESQTPLDNLASPPTFPLQRDFTVFLGKFKAHILSQF
uniref:Uncharacterized protein n=1 Tax=Spermophilus dauricus TaxID=99837 RepID=A0A8C9PJC8_SPEDA